MGKKLLLIILLIILSIVAIHVAVYSVRHDSLKTGARKTLQDYQQAALHLRDLVDQLRKPPELKRTPTTPTPTPKELTAKPVDPKPVPPSLPSVKGLSDGAFGLPWGATPDQVVARLGTPSKKEWSGDHYVMEFCSINTRVQFFAPNKRIEHAKLFSIAISVSGALISGEARVGQSAQQIATLVGASPPNATSGMIEVRVPKIALLLKCYGEDDACNEVSVIFIHKDDL